MIHPPSYIYIYIHDCRLLEVTEIQQCLPFAWKERKNLMREEINNVMNGLICTIIYVHPRMGVLQ